MNDDDPFLNPKTVCEHCGRQKDAKREVNWCSQVRQWLCMWCFFKVLDRQGGA